MVFLCALLSTLRQFPLGYPRMTRGRCGSLLLHRDGLAPSTPCRSPGALRSTPINGYYQTGPVGPFGANNRHYAPPRRGGDIERSTHNRVATSNVNSNLPSDIRHETFSANT